MARIIRGQALVGQVGTSVVTYGTNTGTGVAALGMAITPPNLGARVEKWWINKQTVGTGTGDLTGFLVVSGGTASTRQISDSIVIDVDAAVPTYQEADGMIAPYEVAATDVGKACEVRFTQATTNTNAPGFFVGVIWRL